MIEDWRIWRERSLWPIAPSEYMFWAEALSQLGRASFGEDWLEPFSHRHCLGSVPDPESVFDGSGAVARPDLYANHKGSIAGVLERTIAQPDLAQWRLAYRLFLWDFEHGDDVGRQRQVAVDLILRLLADGKLLATIRDDAGAMIDLQPSAWNCERETAIARLRTCRMDDRHWLFVRRSLLQFTVEGIAAERKRKDEAVEAELKLKYPPKFGPDPAPYRDHVYKLLDEALAKKGDGNEFYVPAIKDILALLSEAGFPNAAYTTVHGHIAKWRSLNRISRPKKTGNAKNRVKSRNHVK